MKARVLFISLAVLILFCCIPDLSAQDTSVSFTIAPPPAGYPVFEKGHTDYRIGANFVTIDSDFMSITGAGSTAPTEGPTPHAWGPMPVSASPLL
jgi:hypothetical protein